MANDKKKKIQITGTFTATIELLDDNDKPTTPPIDPEKPQVGDDSQLLFLSNFETGFIQPRDANPDGWSEQNGGVPNATIVQSGITRTGRYAVKHTLDKKNWDGTSPIQGDIKPRAQLMKAVEFLPYQLGADMWTGVSVFIPEDWENETNANNKVVLWQFHSTGADLKNTSPNLVLNVVNDQLQIWTRYGDLAAKPLVNIELFIEDLESNKGKWVDFVIYTRFANDETGVIQLWKNGLRVVDYAGPCSYTNSASPGSDNSPLYVTLSLYKPKFVDVPTSQQRLTVYYDEFRVAEGKDMRAIVDPASLRKAPKVGGL